MRPPKIVLLVSQDEDKLSLLRFVLSHSSPKPDNVNISCYRVISASSAEEALEYLHESVFDLMLCLCPCASLKSLLVSAKDTNKYMPTVVVYEKGAEAKDCLADLLLHKPTNAELLEKIRIFIQRQHWSGREKNKSPAREIVVQIEEDVA